MKQLCNSNEILAQVQSISTDVTDLRIANNVYKAVYAVAYAIHNSNGCSEKDNGQGSTTACRKQADYQQAWKIMNELKKIRFTTATGEDVFFDENGDPAARYDVLNWQQVRVVPQAPGRLCRKEGQSAALTVYHVQREKSATQQIVNELKKIHFTTTAGEDVFFDENGDPAARYDVLNWQQVNELKKIHFTTATGEDVFFDENGDPAARYDVLNWQQGKDGKTVFVKVGFYDASLQTHLQLSINNNSIVWAHNKPQVRAADPPCSIRGLPNPPQLSKDGDVLIGGIFSFHNKWEQPARTFTSGPRKGECVSLNLREFQSAQTMEFAIEEINNRTDILPGINLGYKIYDACGSVEMTTRAALSLVNGHGENTTSVNCSKPDNVQAIIGQTSSTPTIAISTTVGPLHIPVVSHFASCACLSDRKKHPSFFRTLPSDYFQSRALAQLVKHFGWTWVGTLCSDNDYGNNGISAFISAAKEEGICIEYSKAFFKTDSRERILKIIEVIKASTSKVIVAFVANSDFGFLLREMVLQNMTGFQWIGSESWISDVNTANAEWQHILKGSVGFAIPKANINGLGSFLTKLNPASGVALYKEVWETIFQCKLLTQENVTVEIKQLCKGNESLTQVQNGNTDISDLRIANNVYKAVYAVAYALHNSYGCSEKDSVQEGANMCTTLADNQQPWKVVNELKKIHFTTATGEDVFFDENGDPAARYDVLNWQQGAGICLQSQLSPGFQEGYTERKANLLL
ncbi:hypothetical protein KOW79_003639 [Hemibagrus wyckioides]|uniref:Receptor ligand binding region domain-containing protein n=1 Tax=Hemibagrus wyckioides TaxID=337641 RepID=A0A9D3P3M9_9TELE|nr:hypothetical protein KOW79_003639 [Hemibagrus wyckioides]